MTFAVGSTLTVREADGTSLTFPPHPWPHPWGDQTAWTGTTVLELRRTGEWYSVWKFFAGGEFRSWYVNFDSRSSAAPTASTSTTSSSRWWAPWDGWLPGDAGTG